ncbi:phage tail protein [Octadecabacter sp. G9-8]|uniref:Phage tail protein n=2 Tax=Octadecabacter dasysiphoniae TaxID=2909341 RepID=A0ABS9CXT6_9RHOB|nr:phage tail protein [Octadecabacter dasysiphoniae]
MDSFETDIPFQGASILDPGIETTARRADNAEHSNTGKVPGQMTTSTITLKNGIMPRNDSFHAWYTKIVVNKAKRETITLRPLDESGKSTVAWKLLNAWPAKSRAQT